MPQISERSDSSKRRAARAATANERAAQLAREQSWRNTRRFIVKAAPWVIGGTVTTGLGYIIWKALEGNPTDEQIILEAAKRLGIKKSQEEIDLWKPAYTESTPLNPTIPRLELANQRLKDVLTRMQQSQNPYYKEAYSTLLALVQKNAIALRYDLTGDQTMGVAYSLSYDGSIQREFQVNPDFMINGSTALSAADSLVHEMKHVQQHEPVIEELQIRYSGRAFYDQATAYFGDTQRSYQYEFEAYAYEARSLIYEAGLVGSIYSQTIQEISGKEDRAVKFIQYGSNPSSPEWQNYLRAIIPPPTTIEHLP